MKDVLRLASLISILLATAAIGCRTVPPASVSGDDAAMPETVGPGGAVASDAEAGPPSDARPDTNPVPAEPTFEAVMASYTAWTKRTDQPVPISADIFGLCRLPTASEKDFQNSVHGGDLALLDWVNPQAAAGFAAGGASPFPVGAAIVKEKLAAGTEGIELVARGFMIKRAAGFNPAAGDWDFAYWEPALGIVSDMTRSAACAGCHASSHAKDFVFFDESWRQP
jgi:Cytochrome P460